jgi:hypothetical protein
VILERGDFDRRGCALNISLKITKIRPKLREKTDPPNWRPKFIPWSAKQSVGRFVFVLRYGIILEEHLVDAE